MLTKDTEIFLFCQSISSFTGADLYNVELFGTLYKKGYKVNLIWGDINPNNAFKDNLNYLSKFIKPITSTTTEKNDYNPFLGDINSFFMYIDEQKCFSSYFSKHNAVNRIDNLIKGKSIWICSNNNIVSVILNGIKLVNDVITIPDKLTNLYQIIHHEFYDEEKPHSDVLPENLLSCRIMPHYKTHCIGNPINTSNASTGHLINYRSRKIVSMIGTIDVFRYPFLNKISQIYQGKGLEFIAMGRNDYSKLSNVLYLEPSLNNVSNIYERSLCTLGVFNGRTKLESFAYGIPYCNFDPSRPNDSIIVEFPPYFAIPDQEMPITELKNTNLLKYFDKDSYDKFIYSISSDFVAESLISYIVQKG